MSLSIFPAVYAATEQAAPQGNPYASLLMFAILFGVFYFLLIRPQAKRAKAHRDLVANVKVGDEVVTSGGLMGKITRVDETTAVLSVAKDVNVTIQKQAITATVPAGSIKSF